MNKITVPAGQVIFREGDNNNAMYIVISGTVEIFFTHKGTATRLALMKKGDFFGEMALFRARPRSATARAVLNCELAIIESKQQLEKYLLSNSEFAAKMVRILADRLANTNELLISKLNEITTKEIEYQIEGSP
ncbi:cyclic nucleotide-binding protein [Leptospira perolatii]|uniref:Cyclic nucleotide-binding protein n=1 Tax=Leptospira perolatii TaxID=2023191 RepID=A0A2M9ZPK6_9LEPT|nr:cyclic nucleotide-binding domain-containing protein [Leptospira perolatii]PJZ70737.1 cyclic nucleotide-binding protein [Leptospira perolatii]PJZ73945.1 cyclic nucleotide-binding protein [Leptospira perolatii]